MFQRKGSSFLLVMSAQKEFYNRLSYILGIYRKEGFRPSCSELCLTVEFVNEMKSANWAIQFKGYLPVDDQMEERLRRVCAEIDSLPASAIHVDEEACVVTIDYSQVKDRFEASRQIIRTVRAGDHFVVKPSWEEYEPQPGDIVIEIDPGTSFGSGLHESTRLCLQALEKHVKSGITAVDFGTGSGILAIAAAKIGVSHVTALDADQDAVEVARENVRRNGLEEVVKVRHANSPASVGSQVDLVIANITAETISKNLDSIAGVLKSGGMLIASGMTHNNAHEVEQLLPSAEFRIAERITEGTWVAFIATLI